MTRWWSLRLSALTLSFALIIPVAHAATIPITNFMSCNTATSTNCIVSLTATFPDGHTVNAIKTGRSNTWDSKDFGGNVRTYSAEEWRVDGLKSSSGTNTIVTQFWMQNPMVGPNGTDYGALDMTIFASLFDSQQEKINSPLCENSGLVAPCLFPAQPQPDVIFTIVLNSNLLQPAFTSGSVQDAKMEQRTIDNGFQFTISGKGMKIPVNLPNSMGTVPGEFPQALDDRYYWHMYTIDSRNSQFNWSRDHNCSTGNPVIISNAASAGLPDFNPNTKEISLQVSSPHMSADGLTPEVGVFQANLPLSGIACLWGISPSDLSSEAKVSVTYQDGTAETAVLATKIEGDNFTVNASGYHYSNPTIHFGFDQPKVGEPTPAIPTPLSQGSISSKVTSKVRMILCQKGKVVVKVKAVAPKCPKGYTKK